MQSVLVLTDISASLAHTVILPVCFGKYIMHSLFRHAPHGLLKEARDTELPLHQVADNHHQILAEALKHEQVSLDVIHRLAVLLHGIVYFLKERLAEAVDFHQHLAATRLFSDATLVVLRRDFQGPLKDRHSRQKIYIADSQLRSNHSLIIHTDQRHEVFHSTHARTFCICLLFSEKF